MPLKSLYPSLIQDLPHQGRPKALIFCLPASLIHYFCLLGSKQGLVISLMIHFSKSHFLDLPDSSSYTLILPEAVGTLMTEFRKLWLAWQLLCSPYNLALTWRAMLRIGQKSRLHNHLIFAPTTKAANKGTN